MLRKTSRTALSFAVTTYKALESTNPIPIKGKGIISRLSDITIGVHKVFIRLLNLTDSHSVAVGMIKNYCHQSWIE